MLPEGYQTTPGFDPAEDHIGPFYYLNKEGQYHFIFEAEQKHCNAVGIVHGGVLMTFADFCSCMQGTENYANESCVTISFNCEFVSAGEIGSLIECEVDVTTRTGSMIFATGKIFSGTGSAKDVVLTFSTVLKRLRA